MYTLRGMSGDALWPECKTLKKKLSESKISNLTDTIGEADRLVVQKSALLELLY